MPVWDSTEPRKQKPWGYFHRDWPNLIVADEKTIEAVDNKWSMLGLRDLIPSPSLSFRDQLYGKKAVAAV